MMTLTSCRRTLAALALAMLSQVCPALAGEELAGQARIAIINFQSADSTLTNLFKSSAAYAMFPFVGKSDACGIGVVYERGEPVGEATLTEANVGARPGGEAFYEVIFFETAEALARFKEARFEINSSVTAVAALEGAALNAHYRNGVLVFTLPRSGQMTEVVIIGQKFSYKPLGLIGRTD